FQLSMTLFQLRMTSTQDHFGLLLQGPLSLFIVACLENLLGAAALSDIQFKPYEPRQLSVGVAMGLTHTLNPPQGPVGSHDAERNVKGVVRLRVTNLVDEFQNLLAVRFVDATQPCFKRCRLFFGETVQLAEAIIPVDVTCASIPHPRARS